MHTINAILSEYDSGRQALFLNGRSLHDLHVDDHTEVRPLQRTLFRVAKERYGMAALTFSLALGARFDFSAFSTQEKTALERQFVAAKLDAAADPATPDGRLPHERALDLLRMVHAALAAKLLPPLLLQWEFGEDLAPASQHQASDFVMQISEMAWYLANDFRLRRHRVFLLFCGVRERVDQRVVSALPNLDLPQPDRIEKLGFIEALFTSERRKAATFEPGLDHVTVANLSARTPNKGLEQLVYSSARNGRPITHTALVEEKKADVVRLSEGTLSLLDASRIRGVSLQGATVRRALALLTGWAEQLKAGNPLMPTSVILAGAPSSGKTDLALIASALAQVPGYELLSPKGLFVGQTERQARLQFRVLKELCPCFGFVDEITEAYPMERGQMNLDSGASAAVTAEMLSALSDSSRAGRTLIVATTNCPWRIGSAMASRFVFLPVLAPIGEDYPMILSSILEHLLPGQDVAAADPAIAAAAALFFEKGASPRTMRAAVLGKLGLGADASAPEIALRAARTACAADPRDRASAEFADLYALRVCSDLEFLPWFGCSDTYPFPEYLHNIVRRTDGTIDQTTLNERITVLRSQVNV